MSLDIFTWTLGQPLAQYVFENTEVIKIWARSCLNVADSPGDVPLNDRIVALIFLSEIWRLRPQLVE